MIEKSFPWPQLLQLFKNKNFLMLLLFSLLSSALLVYGYWRVVNTHFFHLELAMAFVVIVMLIATLCGFYIMVQRTQQIEMQNQTQTVDATDTLLFTEEYLVYKHDANDYIYQWDNIYKVTETRRHFILYEMSGVVWPLPKHLFNSSEKLLEFRDWLQKRLGSKLRCLA